MPKSSIHDRRNFIRNPRVVGETRFPAECAALPWLAKGSILGVANIRNCVAGVAPLESPPVARESGELVLARPFALGNSRTKGCLHKQLPKGKPRR